MKMNQITLIGNVGRDPEMSYTASGQSITKFSLAVSRRYTKAGGVKMEHVDWFNVSAWGKTGEIANEYLVKGAKVAITGRVELNQWDGQDGQRRASMEVTVSSLELLGRKPSGDGGYDNADRPVEVPGDTGDVGEASEPVGAGVEDLPF